MSKLTLCLAFAAAVLAAPAWSAPAPEMAAPSAAAAAPLSSEARALGQETAHVLFRGVDFHAMLEGAMSGELDHMFDEVPTRPKWTGFMREALLEEVDAMKPMIEQSLGVAFARYFTLEELRAGVDFLRGPAGAELSQSIADEVAHRPHAQPSSQVSREFQRLGRSAAGRRWAEKFGHVDQVLDSVTSDITAVFMLSVFRRFVDKAQADEPNVAAP